MILELVIYFGIMIIIILIVMVLVKAELIDFKEEFGDNIFGIILLMTLWPFFVFVFAFVGFLLAVLSPLYWLAKMIVLLLRKLRILSPKIVDK